MPNNSFKCYDSFFLRHTSVTHIPMQSGTRLYIEQYNYNLIYWKRQYYWVKASQCRILV